MEKDILLHRQIHPSFVIGDIISTQAFQINISSGAFTPTEKDQDKLSVYNDEKFNAEQAFEHFTAKYISIGVLSVSITEVQTIESLYVEHDNEPFEGHSSINFSQVISKNQKFKKAGKLRDFAVQRNWSFKIEG